MDNLDPGTEFGAYTIEGLIAGGGMGSVYAARHTVYGTPCALKVLHPKLHGDESWRKRFEAEGFAGTTLKHPHVLAARDVVLEEGDQIGLVLDLVKEGLTLHRVMSREYRTGVPLAQALRVFLGIVQGIEYAHQKEIVHGDIKPENVLIQGEFRDPSTWLAKVTDFGTIGILAHPVEIDGMPAVVVSPRYASPEHLKGMVHLEPRSDIYCLGLLLHYMLTGKHASTAKSVEEAAARVAQPTSTSSLLNHPEAVSVLFQKATHRDIDQRFPSARELALAVRDLLDHIGEGLDLDDLQADLATEIVEERKEAAKAHRVEAARAAAAAAEDLESSPGASAEGPDVQVSEVATPLGDLPVDGFEVSEVSELSEATANELSDVVAIDGDDVTQPSRIEPIEPVESGEDTGIAVLPDDRVEVLPDTNPPADVRTAFPKAPTDLDDDIVGEAVLEGEDSQDSQDSLGKAQATEDQPFEGPEDDSPDVESDEEQPSEDALDESDSADALSSEASADASEATPPPAVPDGPIFSAVQEKTGPSTGVIVAAVVVIVVIVAIVLAVSWPSA